MEQTDYCYFSVYVLVKSATTDGSLEGASVELTLDNLVLRNTTDSQGLAVFMVR